MQHSKYRVTLVISSLGAGGAERNLLRLAEGLRDRGYLPTVMTLNTRIPDFYSLPEDVIRAEPPPESMNSPRWFNLLSQIRMRLALRSSLLETRPDVVISFIDTTNIQVLSALVATSIPVVVSERIDWRHHPLNWRWRMMRRALYPFAKRVVSLAREPAQQALDYWPPWPCEYIPNPVPQIPESEVVSPAWFHSKNLISMGRLTGQKGHNLLLRAFAEITNNHPDWGLIILGDGPKRAALENLAKTLRINERVHFTGNVSKPFDLLSAADLFVFPSRYEAFGMALAEAMACGLPVISFDCPSGPADIIRDGVDGLLVPPEDVTALSMAMDRLMGDANLRRKLAEKAPEICKRFDPQHIWDQWCSLIDEVIQESGNAGIRQ